MEDLDIGEVVERAGLPASTLRYYESRGLIASTGRHGMRRQFDPSVLERLGVIALGRSVGFSLDEIGQWFEPGAPPLLDRTMLTARADDLDETITRLTAMRDGLRHAAACPAPSHMECASFRRYLEAAASGNLPASPPVPLGRRA